MNNEKRKNRIIINAITISLLIMLISLGLAHMTAFAADNGLPKEIRAYDVLGHEVTFDEDGHMLSVGPLRFTLDIENLGDGEMYVYDDGSTINPIENYVHIIYPESGDTKLCFYKRDSDGELTKLHEGDLRIDFTDGIYDAPDLRLEEKDGGMLITISPLPHSRTYIDIRGRKNGILEEITERTEFHIKDDGYYHVLAYAEDSLGHRTYSENGGDIMVDNTPPILEDVPVLPAISNTPIHVQLSAYDEVSGVEGIYVKEGDSPEEKTDIKANSIEITPPFKGSIYVHALDNAGNSTEELCLGEDIIVDDEPPSLTVGLTSIDEEKARISVSAVDDLSGTKYVTMSSKTGIIYRGSGNKDEVILDISKLPYGTATYTVEASDLAGNVISKAFSIEKQDGTAPEITLTGARDQGIYGSDVAISIQSSDDSGEECHVEESVSRYTLSGSYIGGATYHDDTLTFNQSGVYLVTAEATDPSGNTSCKSVAFAIDKDAPIIRGLFGLGGSKLKSFMLDLTKDMAVDDGIVNTKLLLNGMDYTGEAVTKDGRYSLQVIASDEFGNTSSQEASFEIRK